MKRKLRYHALAQQDFIATAASSQKLWGARQTRRYLDHIEAQIERIVQNPMLGSDADLPRPGLRKIVAGRHTIFYLTDEGGVLIVRILHQQQDQLGRLGLG